MTPITRPVQPLLALCALLGTACYEYVPSRAPASLVGQRVQLSLTDSGTVAMAGQVGHSIEAIDGTLVGDSAGVYLVSVMATRARTGVESDWRGERVRVAHPLVASLAERRFSRSRSTFAGALMTAGVTAITVALRGSGGATGGGVPTPGTPGAQ
jgi:hypothetical protein